MFTFQKLKLGWRGLALLPVLMIVLGQAAWAAEDGDPPWPGGEVKAGQVGIAARTSPFDPPPKDVFVADSGAGLDTGCTFNNSPGHPLVISVVIDKFVGDVDGSGHLVAPTPLITAGIIPATVDVIMPAYDVDVNGSPPPESDRVTFNGEVLGYLTGDNNIWKLNSFSVDIRKLKFPARPAAGGSVTPAINTVQINIDTLSSGRWCTAIDWVALVVPIRPKLALDMSFVAGNKIRENTGSATIDVIHEQTFDAACNVTNTKEPMANYPFSGPATSWGGWFGGESKLKAKLKTCPENSIDPPELKAEWTVSGGGPSGTKTWTGFENDITVKMPGKVGAYTVDFKYTVNGTDTINVTRKLLVTKAAPTLADPPRRAWYEKGTAWASGKSDETQIIKGVLDGLYAYGGANWRYGYFGPAAAPKCNWEQLVADPITCNYSDCYVFSDVLQNISGTLGVGGLSAVAVYGSSGNGFLTNVAPSLDPAFPGSARPLGGGAYDRYVFSSHSLRKRGWWSPSYYDATFDGIYATQTQFIGFNMTGGAAVDGTGRAYAVTTEGARIYDLPGNSYDSWGNYEYALPPPPAPAPIAPLSMAAAVANIQIPGPVNFQTIDTNADGIYEGVRADFDVQVLAAGTYTVKGRLEKNGTLVANRPVDQSSLFSDVSFQSAGPEIRSLSLTFSGQQIYQSGLDGPYDLMLRGIGATGESSASFPTPAYNHLSFGEALSTITGVSDVGVDDNANGKFEGVGLTVDINVRSAGSYQLLGSLTKNGTTLVSGETLVNLGVARLIAGQQSVPLLLPGLPIRRSGQDGPYEGALVLVDGTGRTVSTFDFVTQPYQAANFEGVIDPTGPFQAIGIDTNANNLYDKLEVTFDAAFSKAGTFLLTGILTDQTGLHTVYSEQLITVVPGIRTVVLEFAGPDIYSQQMNGPYRIEVSLRDPGTQESIDRVALPQETGPFHYTDFDPNRGATAISLLGSSTDHGVDTNGNGKYDQLRVDVGVHLQNAGTYQWSARLVDSSGKEIGFYNQGGTFLPAGNTTIGFTFNGTQIGANGKNGPYFVKGLLIFGAGANLVATNVATTFPYAARDFEGYVPALPGDLNGDGVVDRKDANVMWKAMYSTAGSPQYLPEADLNQDGIINSKDWMLFVPLMTMTR